MTFKVHGPIMNPSIVRLSDGSRIALTNNCVLTSGNFLEVNTAKRTVRLSGLTNALGYISAQNTNWEAFEAPPNPGSVTYELVAASATGAYMEALYRSAYA
jgi:hypothetical protein